MIGRHPPLPWGTHDHTLWGKGPLAQAVAWPWWLLPLLHPDFPVPGLPWGFVVAVSRSRWPGILHKQPGPVGPESILLFCVWVEFDHLLDMFVHWKRALSVCFVSSAPKKYKHAADILFHLILCTHHMASRGGSCPESLLFIDPTGMGHR